MTRGVMSTYSRMLANVRVEFPHLFHIFVFFSDITNVAFQRKLWAMERFSYQRIRNNTPSSPSYTLRRKSASFNAMSHYPASPPCCMLMAMHKNRKILHRELMDQGQSFGSGGLLRSPFQGPETK
jgi:hypothetical protein